MFWFQAMLGVADGLGRVGWMLQWVELGWVQNFWVGFLKSDQCPTLETYNPFNF